MSYYPARILRDGPAAYWRLGEKTGTAAADDSGNASPLAYAGCYTLAAGGAIAADSDTAVQFTGGGATRSTAVMSAVDNITLECWIKATDSTVATGNRCVMFIGAPGGAGYGLYLFSGVAWVLCAGVGSFGFGYSPPVGSWVHLVLVRASGTWTLYVNGVATDGTTGTTPQTPSAHTLIAINDSGAEALNATVDEVAMYAAALSPATIAAHFQTGRNQLLAVGQGINVGPTVCAGGGVWL